MLLVIDVGNTNTKVGLCDDAGVRVSWTLTTRREQTADEYGLFIEALLRSNGTERSHVRAVAVSNVVPPVQQALEWISVPQRASIASMREARSSAARSRPVSASPPTRSSIARLDCSGSSWYGPR